MDLSLFGEAAAPQRRELQGQWARLEPLRGQSHADGLWETLGRDPAIYDYLPDGPYAPRAAFDAAMRDKAASDDPLYYAAIGENGLGGYIALQRIEPRHRVIEIGNVAFGRTLRRTRAATEAVFLLLKYIFDELGYRRCEWKCNAENKASHEAALRFGFVFEGVFRQHMIVKNRNRDTAWFSMLDGEWPTRAAEFKLWLAPENFDAQGVQKNDLRSFRRA